MTFQKTIYPLFLSVFSFAVCAAETNVVAEKKPSPVAVAVEPMSKGGEMQHPQKALKSVEEKNSVVETKTSESDETEKSDEKNASEKTVAEKAEDPKFEKYKTIMDRMPFGPEPANFNPDAPAGGVGGLAGGAGGVLDPAAEEAMKSEEEQKILASVRVSVLNVTPSGKIAVGFTDSSKQPAGNYYLKVGETRDGWTVKEANAVEQSVVLAHDGVEATLKLGEGSAPDAGKGAGKGGPRGPMGLGLGLGRRGVGVHPGGGAPVAASPESPGGSAFANLRARRAQQEAARLAEQQRQAAAAELAKADREKAAAEREQAAAEREQQREALLQIQDELRRAREERQNQKTSEEESSGDGGQQ